MKLNLKPLLRGEVDRLPLDAAVPVESPAGAEFTAEARVTGEIVSEGGCLRLTARVEVPYAGVCARCLESVEGALSLPFNRTIAAEDVSEEDRDDEADEEPLILQNGFLDIGDAVREALILAFPMRLLCSEDCPGLCPVCGKSLRDGPCGCRAEDPDGGRR